MCGDVDKNVPVKELQVRLVALPVNLKCLSVALTSDTILSDISCKPLTSLIWPA